MVTVEAFNARDDATIQCMTRLFNSLTTEIKPATPHLHHISLQAGTIQYFSIVTAHGAPGAAPARHNG